VKYDSESKDSFPLPLPQSQKSEDQCRIADFVWVDLLSPLTTFTLPNLRLTIGLN